MRKQTPAPVDLPISQRGKRKKVEISLPADRTQLYEIADLRFKGHTRFEIAEILKISVHEVDRDNEILDEMWREVALADIDVEKGRDIDRIEKMIGAIWDRALNGNNLTIDRVVKLIERKAMMLGYDAPKRVETNGQNQLQVDVQHHNSLSLDNLTDEQIDLLIQIQEQAKAKEIAESPFVIDVEVREIPSGTGSDTNTK